MRADKDDLKWYDEDGFNTSRIMKQAHMMASASHTDSKWTSSYDELLSDNLEQKWADAKKARDRIEKAGGPSSVREKLTSRKRDRERGAMKDAAERKGNKHRTLVPASMKEQMKETLDGDQIFDSFGKTWTAGDSIASTHGSQYLGLEGEKVCYMYYYEVTDEALDAATF